MAPWSKRFFTVIGMATFLAAGAAHAQVYYVKPGDSLYTIANRFGTTSNELRTMNRLNSTYIYPGQALTIPGGSSSSGSMGTRHTVAYGDSLYKIATRYGVTVEALRRANGITSNQIMAGQVLTIPASSSSGNVGSGSNATHTVTANESLYKIAQRYGTTIATLKSLNGLTGDEIRVGQVLRLPAQGSVSSPSGNGLSLSSSDMDLLARLVTAEAGGESYEGQVAVAATILNRLRDPRYPSTIKGIIYQVVDGRYYQYSPVLDGRINLPAIPQAFKAIDAAIKGWDPSNGAVGFYNPAKTTNAWVRSHPVTATIGLHVFFKN